MNLLKTLLKASAFALAAAVAACLCTGPVTVLGSECVKKSYPRFWEDLEALEVSI